MHRASERGHIEDEIAWLELKLLQVFCLLSLGVSVLCSATRFAAFSRRHGHGSLAQANPGWYGCPLM